MSLFQAIVLGSLQGLTEFLPVSSSAHLYVVPTLLHWPYAGVAFDVALHWGTLIALLVAFAGDWMQLAVAPFSGKPVEREAARALWLRLLVGSLPAVVAGLLLRGRAEDLLRSLPLQAAMLALFGLLLWAADRFRPAGTATVRPNWRTTAAMGLAQALALVPGVSRSGVTITAGRACGLDRVSAARFSFLLATPITLGAGLLELHHLSPGVPWPVVAAGVLSSAVVGLFAIRGLLKWLGRAGFGVFCVYRVAFALVIVATLMRH